MLEDNPLKIEKGRSQLNADSIPNSNNKIDIRNNQEYYVNKIKLLKHKIENNEYNGKEFLELMQSELFSILYHLPFSDRLMVSVRLHYLVK